MAAKSSDQFFIVKLCFNSFDKYQSKDLFN